MSGLVKVRYCKAPARLQYREGSSEGVPEVLSFCLVSTGVADGLQDDMPARSMIFEA
ncbi:hypothetical protein A2U01_0108739 [Trifolium medium]|uniref:Uncharacterized protein n=1 Tax=Trifolium medium TaxID=97028 RepID=A0A392VGE0_9FABA|nr:hypothetical protein [Trifolium medium]